MRGQKLAAQYLASQYRLLGLAPKGTARKLEPLSPSAYFQPFTVYRRLPKETHLEVLANGNKVASSTFSAQLTTPSESLSSHSKKPPPKSTWTGSVGLT